MLEIVLSNQFKKDIKSAQKRGLKLELLTEVVDTLASQNHSQKNIATIL